ncbi:MAG: hypothetical protein J7577_03600 [Sphingobacteriaceae bacterium]|nr:hypothetical protein [Sphingobacteriaceae bacterium]
MASEVMLFWLGAYVPFSESFIEQVVALVALNGVEERIGKLLFIARTFVSKPGKSGSSRFLIGTIADNGTAVSESLLNVRFQIKC